MKALRISFNCLVMVELRSDCLHAIIYEIDLLKFMDELFVCFRKLSFGQSYSKIRNKLDLSRNLMILIWLKRYFYYL